ncbi:hypothetical protein GEMRC1_005420 [Eukaryota sp. GEM-RC1]
MVSSILNHSFDLSEFLNILNSCSIEVFSLQQWDEFLLVPLKDVEELSFDLIKFLFTKVKDCCTDSLVKENCNLLSEIAMLKREIEELKKKVTETEVVHHSKMIRFSQSRKHSEFQVSEDKTRAVVASDFNGVRNVLGDTPLLPGNDYTWKLKYQGTPCGLWVGVIDETKFSLDGWPENGHCFCNDDAVEGCLSGKVDQWDAGELLEINANLINYTLTIKSVRNSSINLTGDLPRLRSGDYYPFALLYRSEHVLDIVE